MNWRDVTDVIQLTLSDSEGPKDDYCTESLHNNSPIQDYLHPNDPTQPTYEMWNHSGKKYTSLYPCFYYSPREQALQLGKSRREVTPKSSPRKEKRVHSLAGWINQESLLAAWVFYKKNLASSIYKGES